MKCSNYTITDISMIDKPQFISSNVFSCLCPLKSYLILFAVLLFMLNLISYDHLTQNWTVPMSSKYYLELS